jgi:hypothetical protein
MSVDVLLALALLAAGGATAVIIPDLVRTARSGRWVVTQGRLLGISVEDNTADYEFEVGGSTFRGKRINTVGYLPKTARARLQQYKTASTVPVWYDPANPQQSALDRTSTLVAWLVGFASVVALAGGLVGIGEVLWRSGK